MKKKIGFLGLGQMGSCLIKTFSNNLKILHQKNYNTDFNDYFYIYDPITTKKEEFESCGFKNYMKDEIEVAKNSEIIFCCLKPDVVHDVLSKTKNQVKKDSLLVSIAAGINIDYMQGIYDKNKIPKIIRIMTNHLCTVNQAGSVYCTNENCDKTDELLIENFLTNVGISKKVNEKLLNSFTALTGSGPAFVYHFIESLVDASVKNGIDVNTAREYAIQNVLGAALYMKESKEKNPNSVQYIVTTPNGTTIAGLNQLNKHKFKYAVTEAISAAAARGKEIESEKYKEMKEISKKINK
jgi:pyrroline-5-carboxylate reductase